MLTAGHTSIVAPGSVRPLTTIKLIRSPSFPSTSRPHLFAPLSQAQGRLYSPLVRSKHPGHSSRASLVPSGTITQTRSKSTWYGRPSNPWSIPTQWHTSSCKWVQSETDPRKTPHDLDCSACQAEQASIHEMSARELQWERQMREVTQWIEDNPYRALFGNSEERLKGLVPEAWKTHWDPMSGRLKRTRENIEVLNKVVRGEVIDLDKDASKIVYKQTRAGQADAGVRSSSTKTQQASKQAVTSNVSNRTVQAQGYWSTYTNNNGNVSEASGKLRYDPITMRLVPDETKNDTIPAPKDSGEQWPRKVPVAQDSVTFSTDAPTTSAISSSQVKSEDANSLKEKLEKSFAETRKSMKSHSEEFNKAPTTKTASDDMGAAWRKEQSVSMKATGETAPVITSNLDGMFAQTKSSLESAWTGEKQHDNVSSLINSNPHYLGHSKPLLSHEAQLASMSLKKKDKPLRHMRGWELGQHKASLLASWSKKADEAKPDKSQEHLNNEVLKQKTAFASHEGKWRLRDIASTNAASSAVTTPVAKSSVVGIDETKVREKEDANALVRNVREIYENAYGVIDTTHRQGDIQAASPRLNVAAKDPQESQIDAGSSTQEAYLDDALSDYDRKMGSSGYDYKTGQDSLEEEVKNKGVSDALKPTAEEPKSKQYKLSDIIKKPSSTNMTPVNPIDGMTRPRTFAEYMDAQTFSPTGFSSPGFYQPLTETQSTLKAGDDAKVSAPSSEVLEAAAIFNMSDGPNAPSVESGSSGVATGAAADTTLPTYPKPAASPPSEEAQLQSLRSPTDGRPQKWTTSEETLLKDLHHNGLSAEDLAAIHRLRRWTTQETATLRRLDRQGLTVRDVATLSNKPSEWTKEETNKLTMVLAQNLPSAYRNAAEDVTELKALYEKGLSSADIIATKRLSKWTPKELALLERMSMSDIMILDKQSQGTPSTSATSESTANSRIIRKQESVFSGGPVNATSSAEEPRINKRRKRSVKAVAEAPSEDTFTSSAHKMASTETVSRYPSSFLHSTRTYMPTGSLFGSGNGSSSNGTPPSHDSAKSGNREEGKRGGFQRKLKAAGYIAAACYATSMTIEYLRSGTTSPAASASATDDTITVTPKASRESSNRKRKSEAAATEVSPMAASSALPKEEDTYIEAAKKAYQRNAWDDELLNKLDAGPVTSIPSLSSAGAATAISANAQADKGAATASPVLTAKVDIQEGSGGGIQGLAALGAGVVAAVVVLLGGFGGSG